MSYVLSFIYLGIYWNNHHHLFQAAEEVSGGISLGEFAPSVLALAVSLYDGLGGREPSRSHANRGLRLCSIDSGDRLLHSGTHYHRQGGPRIRSRVGQSLARLILKSLRKRWEKH